MVGVQGVLASDPSSAISMLFPFLFITIACGACSGFHSIVSSGTTCKQIRSEKDVRPVAYGAMLLEAMVAVFALSCVMVLAAGFPGRVAGRAVRPGDRELHELCVGVPMYFAVSFGLLAFSSFVFDTMDVCTRLGRYVMQEMLGVKGLAGGIVATLVTLAAPSLYLWTAPVGCVQDVLDDLRHQQPAPGGADTGGGECVAVANGSAGVVCDGARGVHADYHGDGVGAELHFIRDEIQFAEGLWGDDGGAGDAPVQPEDGHGPGTGA